MTTFRQTVTVALTTLVLFVVGQLALNLLPDEPSGSRSAVAVRQ
jgi:hypothetical protein